MRYCDGLEATSEQVINGIGGERLVLDNEGSYVCDGCGEDIVVPIDWSEGKTQDYVEDCPVCCRPSLIHVDISGDEVRVWAEPEQDRY